MKSLFAATLLSVTPFLSVADIPVHCLHRQTVGTWNFKLGSNKNDDTLTCGHKLPDEVMTMVDQKVRYKSPNFSVDSEYKVTLTNPNIATDEKGNKGTWTMIYDEGFEVNINGRKFFSFFCYEPKVQNPSPDENADFYSICDEVFSGWYHNNDETDWGCYVGKHIGGGESVTTDDDSSISNDHVVQPDSLLEVTATHLLRSGAAASTRRVAASINLHSAKSTKVEQEHVIGHYDRQRSEFDQKKNHEMFVTDTAFIDVVNSDPLSKWTARHYGEKFESLTHGDLRQMLGKPKYTNRVANKDPFPSQEQVSFIEQSATPEEQEALKVGLPKDFDWRNEDNIVTDVISQGSCGSCYAIAMVDAMTMRLRVHTKGKDQTILSPQNVVSCSDYNQGCEGGYPFLVAKFGEDIGYVPSYCEHYTAEDSACRVSCPSDKPLKVYHAKDYKYIGGYYGACNEASMMHDLYHHGPIVVALNAPSDLFYYNGGVYDSKDTDRSDFDITKTSRWEKTNHAVTAIGWGEDNGEKYWIIKNSWGDSWGMNGYFKMSRGKDEIASESMAASGKIVLPVEGTKLEKALGNDKLPLAKKDEVE